MEKVANKNCRNLVEKRQEFDGSNLYARNIGKLYIVYSWGKHYPMFIFRKGWWYENSDSYSRSTGRHHSNARPYHGLSMDNYNRNIKLLTTQEMKNIIQIEVHGN